MDIGTHRISDHLPFTYNCRDLLRSAFMLKEDIQKQMSELQAALKTREQKLIMKVDQLCYDELCKAEAGTLGQQPTYICPIFEFVADLQFFKHHIAYLGEITMDAKRNNQKAEPRMVDHKSDSEDDFGNLMKWSCSQNVRATDVFLPKKVENEKKQSSVAAAISNELNELKDCADNFRYRREHPFQQSLASELQDLLEDFTKNSAVSKDKMEKSFEKKCTLNKQSKDDPRPGGAEDKKSEEVACTNACKEPTEPCLKTIEDIKKQIQEQISNVLAKNECLDARLIKFAANFRPAMEFQRIMCYLAECDQTILTLQEYIKTGLKQKERLDKFLDDSSGSKLAVTQLAHCCAKLMEIMELKTEAEELKSKFEQSLAFVKTVFLDRLASLQTMPPFERIETAKKLLADRDDTQSLIGKLEDKLNKCFGIIASPPKAKGNSSNASTTLDDKASKPFASKFCGGCANKASGSSVDNAPDSFAYYVAKACEKSSEKQEHRNRVMNGVSLGFSKMIEERTKELMIQTEAEMSHADKSPFEKNDARVSPRSPIPESRSSSPEARSSSPESYQRNTYSLRDIRAKRDPRVHHLDRQLFKCVKSTPTRQEVPAKIYHFQSSANSSANTSTKKSSGSPDSGVASPVRSTKEAPGWRPVKHADLLRVTAPKLSSANEPIYRTRRVWGFPDSSQASPDPSSIRLFPEALEAYADSEWLSSDAGSGACGSSTAGSVERGASPKDVIKGSFDVYRKEGDSNQWLLVKPLSEKKDQPVYNDRIFNRPSYPLFINKGQSSLADY